MLFVLDLAGFVVLSRQVQCFGLDPEVDVLGHQYDLHVGLVVLQLQCRTQDLVVIGLFVEYAGGIDAAGVALCTQHNAQQSFGFILQGNPVLQSEVFAQPVNDADAFSGLEILGVIAHLEGVELFQHGDGNGNAVVFEIPNGIVVVEEHRSVDDKHLGPLVRGLLVWFRLRLRRRSNAGRRIH